MLSVLTMDDSRCRKRSMAARRPSSMARAVDAAVTPECVRSPLIQDEKRKEAGTSIGVSGQCRISA